MQFTSFCSSCTLPDNSKIVFWSSISFRLAIVSQVELWNFRHSSISVRLCWWASRNSNFCRHNWPCRSRRSSSAWAAWSSCAIIVCLCSSSRLLICAFELLRSSGFPDRSTIRSIWMPSEKLLWALITLNVTSYFPDWSTILSPSGCPDPSNITDDDWLTDTPPGTQQSTCRWCAAVSISPSVTSSTSWSVEGILKEMETDESLSSPQVRRLGS